MSQQDDEFEEWFAQQVWPAGNGAGWAMCRAAWQAARRAPEHEKAAPTAEPVAEFVYFSRLQGNVYNTLTKEKLKPGTKLYTASHPPVSAEQRERLEDLLCNLDMFAGRETVPIHIARDLAALCEEVMDKPTG